jgi:hypothetical protein
MSPEKSGLRKLRARDIALVAIFSALSVIVITVLPGIPIIGVQGGRIALDAVLAPIYGLVIGPYLGALAAFIGGMIVAKGNIFNIMTSFAPLFSAFVAGMMVRKSSSPKILPIEGWKLSALVLSALITGWYLTPVGRSIPLYPILHLSGLVIILLLRDKASEFFWSNDKKRLLVSIVCTSFCGLISDHMFGNLAFILLIGWLVPLDLTLPTWLRFPGWAYGVAVVDLPSIFMFVLPISTIERTAMTAVATIIGTSLILALRAAQLLQED